MSLNFLTPTIFRYPGLVHTSLLLFTEVSIHNHPSTKHNLVDMLTTESRAMVAANTALMVLAITSVVLRFQVRMPKALPLKLDDYMILTALVRLSHPSQGVRC